MPLIGIGVLVGLYISSLHNYLLFHSLVEIFSIIVAFGIFMLSWNSRRFMKNYYFLFIGIAYMFIGFMDMIHTLAYTGMGIFPGYGSNLPTQLWVATRYMESLTLFIASFFISRKTKVNLVWYGYLVFVILILFTIFYWDIFPVCFTENNGLTPFKIISEYIISGILVLAILILRQKREYFNKRIYQLIVASMIVTIASEMSFTLYKNVFGIPNLIGHFLKIISFYLIYKAVIEIGLTRPYDLLFHDLMQSQDALLKEKRRLEQQYLRQETLAEAELSISEPNELKTVLDRITRSALERLPADGGAGVILWDEETSRFELKSFTSNQENIVDSLSELPGMAGATGWIVKNVKPLIVSDILKEPFYAEIILRKLHIRSYIGVPLIVGGTTLGVIYAWNKEPHDFTKDEIDFMLALSIHASMALSKVKIFQELAEAKEKAEKASRFKSDFLASMSHELRTPLNSVIGYSEMLEVLVKRNQHQEYIPDLALIREAGEHLLNIINDVLDLSKIEAGKIEFFPETIPIIELVQDLLFIIKPLAEKNTNQLEIICPLDIGTFQADLTRVRQVILNILSNACKFTQQGVITFEVTKQEIDSRPWISFRIQDTGIGMDSEQITKIFNEYSQVDKDSKRRQRGTGLGLFISKQFCEMMGGKITVKSAPDKGSVFTVKFPVSQQINQEYIKDIPKQDTRNDGD